MICSNDQSFTWSYSPHTFGQQQYIPSKGFILVTIDKYSVEGTSFSYVVLLFERLPNQLCSTQYALYVGDKKDVSGFLLRTQISQNIWEKLGIWTEIYLAASMNVEYSLFWRFKIAPYYFCESLVGVYLWHAIFPISERSLTVFCGEFLEILKWTSPLLGSLFIKYITV